MLVTSPDGSAGWNGPHSAEMGDNRTMSRTGSSAARERADAAGGSALYEELLEKNRRYLWNPFTQMKEFLDDEPLIVARAEGVRLYDVRGNEYLDGNSSLWLNVHGHNRRELNDAIVAQLDRVAHSTLLGASNVPAIELAARKLHAEAEAEQRARRDASNAGQLAEMKSALDREHGMRRLRREFDRK